MTYSEHELEFTFAKNAFNVGLRPGLLQLVTRSLALLPESHSVTIYFCGLNCLDVSFQLVSVAVEQLVIVVNCMTFFSYSVTVFQLLLELELLTIIKLQLQLELTDAYFSVITGFQSQLLLTGITLLLRPPNWI